MTTVSEHRPWPVPIRPWAMRMRWCDLLFAHWKVDPAVLRRLIPIGLELDLFDGEAYVGAVPFRMEGVSPRCVPNVPGLHAFPELNLRTYVKTRTLMTGDPNPSSKPGVWFFSLDAGQKLAVRAARRFFHLPYFDAGFQLQSDVEGIREKFAYAAIRTHRNAPAARFEANYYPVGDPYQSIPGTLDSWLTDRYCLYSADQSGALYRGEIDHHPWPLQPATAEVQVNNLGDWLGIEMNGPPATLHFARSLDVRAWLLDRI